MEPNTLTAAKCDSNTQESNGPNNKCQKSCAAKLVIKELSPGKSYIIDVKTTDITSSTGFKQRFFYKTGIKHK